MLQVNTDATVASLDKAKLEIKRKLLNMVVEFGVDVAEAASRTTPIGSPEDFKRLYLLRMKETGISPDEAGYHAGAWVYSESQNIPFSPNISSPSEMSDDVRYAIESGYTLGETFYIGASGPAYTALDKYKRSSQAPDGIIKPTEQLIESTYRINLKSSYDKG